MPSALRELTLGLARGDDAVWASFHRHYGPGIFRHLLAAARGDHALASEALQQTYLRVVRHARPCEVPAQFAAWLRLVARSALSDCRRRRRSFWELLRRRHQEPEELASPDAEATEVALDEALAVALAQLSAPDRELLEQKYFAGMEVRALAAKLDLTPKAVESRLTRARLELRRRMLAILQTHDASPR